MFNKILSAVTALALVAGAAAFGSDVKYSTAPLTANALKGYDGTYENLRYFKYEDHITVTACNKSIVGECVIPAEIEGLPVTKIDDWTFSECSGLTNVTIPDSVTSIGWNAFNNCTGLTEITIPDSVTALIWGGTFRGCTSLTKIVIPDSITKLQGYTFIGCTNLTDITIPDSVTYIDGRDFQRTAWLKNKQKENPMVIVNNILVDGNICEGRAVIPDGVVSISGYSFDNTSKVTEVIIPDSVTSIIGYAFHECPTLTEITIPESVESIGDSAFYGCSALTEITILNPNCEIYDANYTITNGEENFYFYYNGVIRGYENSTAQAYAKKYGYEFESLGEAPTTEPTKDDNYLAGDANCDGIVSIADSTAILQHLGNRDKYALSAQGEKNADVDGQAGITASDALTIQQYDAKLVSKLPVA